MNRRNFIKAASGLFVPVLLLPRKSLGQFASFNDQAFLSQAPAGFCSQAATWASNVVTNGGTKPSNAIQTALCTYWASMQAAGLDTATKYMVIMPVGQLAAVITPFVFVAGANPALNQGPFVSGDLGANGLTGNASNKWLDTQVNMGTAFSPTNIGWSVYVYNTTGTGFIIGGYSSTGIIGAAHHSDGKAYSYNGTIASNVISLTSPGNGFYSGNRTSSTSHQFFFANSGSSPAQIGSTDSTSFGGTLPNSAVNLLFGENAIGLGAQFLSSDTISYGTWHLGYNLSQYTSEYNAAQTLLTTLGGGFR